MRTSKIIALVCGIFAAMFVASLALRSATHARVAFEPVTPITDDAASAVMSHLLVALERPATAQPVTGEATPLATLAAIYTGGKRIAFERAEGDSLAAQATALATTLRANPRLTRLTPEDRANLRVRLDFVRARVPVSALTDLHRATSFVAADDGAAIELDGTITDNPPDPIIRAGVFFSGHKLVPGQGFDFAANLPKLIALLARESHADADDIKDGVTPLYRVKLDSFIDEPTPTSATPTATAPRYALRLSGMRTPVPEVTRESAIAAAKAGAEWLVRHLHPDGRFTYIYLPERDATEMKGYNYPRHGGTTYSMFLMAEKTGDPRYKEAALKGTEFILANLNTAKGANGKVFVAAKTRMAKTGSAGLALAALAYARRIGIDDPRIVEASRDLANYIVSLQKPNGDFIHYYDRNTGKELPGRVIYYNGESLYGLSILAQLEPENETWRTVAEKGIDFLTGPDNLYFMREFFPISDSWICMAIEEFAKIKTKPQHTSYAKMVAHTYTDTQMFPGQTEQPYMIGGYAPSVLFNPRTTPASTNLEGLISAVVVARNEGKPDPRIEEGMRHGLRFLIYNQFNEHDTYVFPKPELGLGGFRRRLGHYEIRNDYVQHAISALIRGAELLPASGTATP